MTPTANQVSRAWHIEPAEAVLTSWNTTERGLSQADVVGRQQQYGLNVLPERGPTPVWKIILRQFASPLIYILLAAAVMSAVIGDLKDALFIGAVLLLNTVIGSWQEWQAEKNSYALRKLLRMHAQVERDGEVREIKAEDLVPGDIVWLESDNRVPADIRLLTAQGLEMDESLLTGESLSVRKDFTWRVTPRFGNSHNTSGRLRDVRREMGLIFGWRLNGKSTRSTQHQVQQKNSCQLIPQIAGLV